MKKYQVTISKQIHGELADGARRTGKSMAEFADQVLCWRLEAELPLLAEHNPADLPNLVKGKGRTEEGNIISQDGNYSYMERLDTWVKISS